MLRRGRKEAETRLKSGYFTQVFFISQTVAEESVCEYHLCFAFCGFLIRNLTVAVDSPGACSVSDVWWFFSGSRAVTVSDASSAAAFSVPVLLPTPNRVLCPSLQLFVSVTGLARLRFHRHFTFPTVILFLLFFC